MKNASVSEGQVVDEIATRGIAILEGITRTQFERIFDTLAVRRPHRDSDDALVTHISPKEAAIHAGYAGFSSEPLTPHTDGTAWPNPPGLLAAFIQEQARSGGESTFVDGQRLVDALDPGDRALLTTVPVRFGTPPGFVRTILEPDPDGYRLCYRDDGLVDMSSLDGAQHRLRARVAALTENRKLDEGAAYFILNGRWLHGRSGFLGQRTMLRIIGDLIHPLPCITLRGLCDSSVPTTALS